MRALALPRGQSAADGLGMWALDLFEDGEGGLGERDGMVSLAKVVERYAAAIIKKFKDIKSNTYPEP